MAPSTAVCMEDKVVCVLLLPVKNIRRPHSVLILRGFEGPRVGLIRVMLMPSGVGGIDGMNPEATGDNGE